MDRKRIEPAQGQESVWDYPCPPRIGDAYKKVKVGVFICSLGGITQDVTC